MNHFLYFTYFGTFFEIWPLYKFVQELNAMTVHDILYIILIAPVENNNVIQVYQNSLLKGHNKLYMIYTNRFSSKLRNTAS